MWKFGNYPEKICEKRCEIENSNRNGKVHTYGLKNNKNPEDDGKEQVMMKPGEKLLIPAILRVCRLRSRLN